MRRLVLLGSLICVLVLEGAHDLLGQRTAAKPAAVWVRIPITGTIGEDFTADDMRGGLRRAKSARADVVVLVLDTPGGRLDHAEEIIDIIIRARGIRFVAVVNRALSAGAAITLACPEIFTTETATIGAATSFMADARGIVALPKDVAEKFQSAWRAVCRKAAQHGKHSALLAEAMVDASFTLSMTKTGGKVVIAKGTKGEVLKTKGQILTLTAREAVACGLAKGMVSDAGAVGKELGLAGWKEHARLTGTSAAGKDALGELYQLLSGKTAELKLNKVSSLTHLQKSVAMKQWDAWLERQKLEGRRIRWQVRLVESIDVSIPELKRYVGLCTDELNAAKRALRRSPRSKRIQQAVRERQKLLAEAKKQFEDVRAWPFVVGATATGYPDRVIVFARFGKSAQSYLARAQRGAIIPLSGRIEKTTFGTLGITRGFKGTPFIDPRFGPSRDRKLYMQIWLRACSIDTASPSSRVSSGGQDRGDAETKAGRLLKMAALYQANNKPDLANAMLKSIIEEYPKTKAAAKAKLQLGRKD
ncbi:MAG: hypothetical protein QGH60_19420 [Phycisphaerae bacterium]|jgi:hypothetical protein|nr:hypothetical protein [Phycisphaerae bacterium]